MDDMIKAVKTCFNKYADFNGRAERPEFWWFALFCFVVNTVAKIVFASWIAGLFSLALLVPSLAAGTRRLHDIGKSGWWLLLGLIPLVNLVLLYFMVQPSEPESNAYGPPPVV